MKKRAIDDDTILNSYYDDRCTFVVDFDEDLVDVDIRLGTVIFKLREKRK